VIKLIALSVSGELITTLFPSSLKIAPPKAHIIDRESHSASEFPAPYPIPAPKIPFCGSVSFIEYSLN